MTDVSSAVTGAIVVGVDGSEPAAQAVRWAAREAALRHLPLHLVYGFDPMFGYYGGGLPAPQSLFDELEAFAQGKLTEAADLAREIGPELRITTSRPNQPPIPVLLELGKKAEMIALGASGRGGFTGMLAGSTTIAVAAHAACPVAVVRTRDDGTVPADGPVVVGVDGSRTSERALGVAFDEASWRGVPLIAVHSWSDVDYLTSVPVEYALLEQEPPDEEQRRVLAESLAGWQDKYPDVQVERVVVKDRPRRQLLEWAGKAQLVVAGSRGRGGFTGMLLGSTSQALIHHAGCPVLIVRPEQAG
ncbi:universal stress protein [Amycolatopsis cynarae]|uniref:Universal stress protein n=1 Tax=Amycolatopsis cynarae TaxID=2995223 RepID=A0ABY7AX68_9PSEU|nr:universal stress protein [Amycolatopsis sp. HUAS 11-8]WAL63286.1 universal stress protein [Amycolatopsis sp. HUAS 11-8]